MKLSTKGRYGTRALLELALNQTGKPVLLRDIAESQEISLSYLEHLIAPLIAGGIVRSTKGPRGGVSLAKHRLNLLNLVPRLRREFRINLGKHRE